MRSPFLFVYRARTSYARPPHAAGRTAALLLVSSVPLSTGTMPSSSHHFLRRLLLLALPPLLLPPLLLLVSGVLRTPASLAGLAYRGDTHTIHHPMGTASSAGYALFPPSGSPLLPPLSSSSSPLALGLLTGALRLVDPATSAHLNTSVELRASVLDGIPRELEVCVTVLAAPAAEVGGSPLPFALTPTLSPLSSYASCAAPSSSGEAGRALMLLNFAPTIVAADFSLPPGASLRVDAARAVEMQGLPHMGDGGWTARIEAHVGVGAGAGGGAGKRRRDADAAAAAAAAPPPPFLLLLLPTEAHGEEGARFIADSAPVPVLARLLSPLVRLLAGFI
jgi:hypothetical protein